MSPDQETVMRMIEAQQTLGKVYRALQTPEKDLVDTPPIEPRSADGKSITGRTFAEYEGPFTITAEDWEGGNLEVYTSPENVPKQEILVPDIDPDKLATWRPIAEAPRDCTHIMVRMADGTVYPDCHWACDLSAEEQPPFMGWFVPSAIGYKEISDPVEWRARPPAPEPVPCFECNDALVPVLKCPTCGDTVEPA